MTAICNHSKGQNSSLIYARQNSFFICDHSNDEFVHYCNSDNAATLPTVPPPTPRQRRLLWTLVGHSIQHHCCPPLLSLAVLIVRTPTEGHSIHHLCRPSLLSTLYSLSVPLRRDTPLMRGIGLPSFFEGCQVGGD